MIHWTVNPNVSMFAIGDVMEHINETLIGNPEIIFGTTTDDNLAIDEIKITIVATGFESPEEPQDEETIKTTQKSSVNINTRLSAQDSESQYDLPPLMRGYSIKYNLAKTN
jgi:cell division protein FtsZ